jgi:hypothetical protein
MAGRQPGAGKKQKPKKPKKPKPKPTILEGF